MAKKSVKRSSAATKASPRKSEKGCNCGCCEGNSISKCDCYCGCDNCKCDCEK